MTITRNFSVLANGAGSANNLSLGGATLGSNALAVTGTTQLNSALNYGGVTLSNAVTGTGSMVLSISPTLTGTAAGQTNNAASETYWQVLNNSASNGAFAILRGSNGTSNVDFGMTGTGYAGVGAYIANQAYVRCDAANGFGIYAPTGPIKFAGSGFSEVARFDTSGNLLVGTTTAGGKLTVTANASIGMAINCGTSGAALYLSSSFNGIQIQLGNAGNAGNISSSAGTTAYNTTSDIRRKEINVPQINYRDNINQLWVGNYTRYANFEHTGDNIEDFGVLAQQAHPLFSNAITKPDSDDGVWMADNSKFGLLALWGVKDLYKIIDELTTRLAALEAK